jgi:hypothetical protein
VSYRPGMSPSLFAGHRVRPARACALLAALLTFACSDDSDDGGVQNGVDAGDGDRGGESAGGGRSSKGSGGASGKGDGGSKGDGDGGSKSGSGGKRGGGGAPPAGTSTAAEIATKLGRAPNFLVGMGNDLPQNYDWSQSGVHTLPVTLDLHYEYLTGLRGQGGWPDWNPDGFFPIYIAQADDAKGVTPMATLYSMAAWGESNLAVLTNDEYMGPYWAGAKLLFERFEGDFGKPAVVHVEPDFWAFAQNSSGGDPTSVPVHLHEECSDLPADLTGFGKCLVQLARTYAPKVVIGFHASVWAGSGTDVGNFLKQCGGDQTDIVAIDMLDRDAGCFEAHVDPACQRGGEFYWDETNQTSPNFHEHLAWAKDVSAAIGKPILWWQVPFGVPSDTPGGTAGHYRDNRVKYVFEHVQEFVDAGGLGIAFGTGAGNQTYITTDGGQFADAVTGYYANPVPLP